VYHLLSDARTLCQTHATLGRYFVELLDSYAKLQRFTPSLHPDSRRLESSAMGPDLDMRLSPGSCGTCVNDIRRSPPPFRPPSLSQNTIPTFSLAIGRGEAYCGQVSLPWLPYVPHLLW